MRVWLFLICLSSTWQSTSEKSSSEGGDATDTWNVFNSLSDGDEKDVFMITENELEDILNNISNSNDTEQVNGLNVTFPDIAFNPDSWEIGGAVVDKIINNGNNDTGSLGAVYPGMMQLKGLRPRVQCTGRNCDRNMELIVREGETRDQYVTLPLFGRNNVLITLYLPQEFELNQIEMSFRATGHRYHFKIRKRVDKSKMTMFDITDERLRCGVDFDESIKRVCGAGSQFQYGGREEVSRLYLSGDRGGPNNLTESEAAAWLNTKSIEIVLLPVEGGPTVYGVSDVKLFGKCLCSGHAGACTLIGNKYHCACKGNTCGMNCEECCPQYNAFQWKPATQNSPNSCTECLCYGKASSCQHEPRIEAQGRSFLTESQRGGGGVCQECGSDTTGINCQACRELYYRPGNMTKWAPFPCFGCDCHLEGVVSLPGWPDGDCVKDDSYNTIQGKPMTPGQCYCKEGWTGRRCDRCLPGFYLTSSTCTPCHCSTIGSSLSSASSPGPSSPGPSSPGPSSSGPSSPGPSSGRCDDVTGQCPCRDGYTGVKCDRCTRRGFKYPKCTVKCGGDRTGAKCDSCTMGFFMDLGRCRKCSCSPHSSCDPVTGTCTCNSGFAGSTCSTCTSPALTYPQCKVCTCDTRGSVEGCDACSCKDNVEGPKCGTCSPGHFGLAADHVTGCLQCYCSRVSAQCTSAITTATTVSSLFDYSTDGWSLTDGVQSTSLYPYNYSLYAGNSSSLTPPVFFSAPDKFLGNNAASYGGFFNFSYGAEFVTSHRANDSLHIWLVGRDTAIKHLVKGQMENGQLYTIRVRLLESHWEGRENVVTRTKFLEILVDLKAVLISASFVSPFKYTRLLSPGLTVRSVISPLRGLIQEIPPSSYVEQCSCPLGYSGNYCESCIAGYYRQDKICQRCECNLRSNMCDEKGACLDCIAGTAGPHCEVCGEGYYQSSTTPLTCSPCPCPNNGSCIVDGEGGVRCTKCLPGVTGNLCDRCIKGWYGTPLLGCKECRCHGNLDMSRDIPCDQETGRCLACVEGTEGTFCEKCSIDYWSETPGDQCKRCSCPVDRRELVPCEPLTGKCVCKHPWTGHNCTECKPYTYGSLNDGECIDCECNPAGSHSLHCNGTTGACFCRRGHAGRKCDRCVTGYHRASLSHPCSKCGCDELGAVSQRCDSVTGQCRCRPGYAGSQCAECDIGFFWGSENTCSECGKCSQMLIDSVESSRVREMWIKPVSQDMFIKKTTAKLKHLKQKSHKIRDKMIAKLVLYNDFTDTFDDVKNIVFTPSKNTKSLPRQADKILIRSVDSDRRIMNMAKKLDRSNNLKSQYFKEALVQYEFTRQRLPRIIEDLSVSRSQVKAISREVRRLDNRDIDDRLEEVTRVRDEQIILHHRSNDVRNEALQFKKEINDKSRGLTRETSRVRDISTTIAELQYSRIDGGILLDTRTVIGTAKYVTMRFVGWENEVESKFDSLEDMIEDTINSLNFNNLSIQIGEVKALLTTVSDLHSSVTPPTPLNSNSCTNSMKLITSVHKMFTSVLAPQPVRDINLVSQIISDIDDVIRLQNLTTKYWNVGQLAKKTDNKANKYNRKITRLKSSVEVCNHRLKAVEADHRADRDKLTNIQSYMTVIRNSLAGKDESYLEKAKLLDKQLSNLTKKRRRFRSLDRSVGSSMSRLQHKINNVKSKVLAFETAYFDTNQWSRYKLPKEFRELSLQFKSEKKTGVIFSIGDKGSEEDLLVSLSRNTISVVCYEPTTVPLYPICVESDGPCYPKMGDLHYIEWFDPRATFDPEQFATIKLKISYGEVGIVGLQQDRVFYNETTSCSLTSPQSLVIAKKPGRDSELVEAGFTGCITQFYINKTPRGIRQADQVTGALAGCEDQGRPKKREYQCGMSYLSLSSRTLLQSTNSESLDFNVVIGTVEDRVTLMSAGELKVTARKGNIRGVCRGIRINFTNVYQVNEPFQMNLNIFENYISLTFNQNMEKAWSRKLPCVLKSDRNDFILGSEVPNISAGCIKKL